jgi:hypothetical protein
MRVLTSVLMPLSLLIFVSGCSCTPETKYVDRIVYTAPVVPEVHPTTKPSVILEVWGDYKVYKEQCEAQIKVCNADKVSIIDSLKTDKNTTK